MTNVVVTCEMEEETRGKIRSTRLATRNVFIAYRENAAIHDVLRGAYGEGFSEQEAIRDLLDKERNQ